MMKRRKKNFSLLFLPCESLKNIFHILRLFAAGLGAPLISIENMLQIHIEIIERVAGDVRRGKKIPLTRPFIDLKGFQLFFFGYTRRLLRDNDEVGA